MFECEVCGRSFKNKGAMASHVRAKHPQPEPKGQPERLAPARAMDEESWPMVELALDALGLEREAVMSWRVYDDRVVLIVGPVGQKVEYVLPNH